MLSHPSVHRQYTVVWAWEAGLYVGHPADAAAGTRSARPLLPLPPVSRSANEVTYSVTVTNEGATAANDVDLVPAATTVSCPQSVSVCPGTPALVWAVGQACHATQAEGTQLVNCPLGTLQAGRSASTSVVMKVVADLNPLPFYPEVTADTALGRMLPLEPVATVTVTGK